MTAMTATRIFLTLAAAAAMSPIAAQETDELQPAVDTSRPADYGPAVDTSAADEPAAPDSGDEEPMPAARSTSDGPVMDRMTLSRTEITGNQELPKVMYIVPWQKSDPGDLMGRPVNTLLDEVLAPVDRAEFVRQVEYYDDLYGESEE